MRGFLDRFRGPDIGGTEHVIRLSGLLPVAVPARSAVRRRLDDAATAVVDALPAEEGESVLLHPAHAELVEGVLVDRRRVSIYRLRPEEDVLAPVGALDVVGREPPRRIDWKWVRHYEGARLGNATGEGGGVNLALRVVGTLVWSGRPTLLDVNPVDVNRDPNGVGLTIAYEQQNAYGVSVSAKGELEAVIKDEREAERSGEPLEFRPAGWLRVVTQWAGLPGARGPARITWRVPNPVQKGGIDKRALKSLQEQWSEGDWPRG